MAEARQEAQADNLGTGRDHTVLRCLWADLEKIGSQYQNGFITEGELLQRHLDLAVQRLAEHLAPAVAS